MEVSEARLAANRANAQKSRGPATPEGKTASRRNALKHGLSGEGIVVPEGDAEEIERRVEALTADMKPGSTAGVFLIAQMATLSVRLERAAEQEIAQTAMRVRNAADAFDEERIERAKTLFESLADDPRDGLRKLRKMPEGVERLIDEWRDLRDDLTIDPSPEWTEAHLGRAALLAGLKPRHARGSRLGALSRGVWGDFAALTELDAGLDEGFRREYARSILIEQIDAEIAALQAHYETLDFATIELDRAEAGTRALFDPSRPAQLAHRYESEAHRGFFKALKEFRIVEAESEAKAEATPAPLASPILEPRMGSFRETAPPPAREPSRAFPDGPPTDEPMVQGPKGHPSRTISTARPPA